MCALRKQFVLIIQLAKHQDQHSDQGNGKGLPSKNSVFRKEDFECDEKSNPQPDVTEEEFYHFVTNRSRIKVNHQFSGTIRVGSGKCPQRSILSGKYIFEPKKYQFDH